MSNLSIEKSLIHFANTSIGDHLAGKKQASLFQEITDRLNALDTDVGGYVLSAEEAGKLRLDPPKSLDTSHITGKLRKSTKLVLADIATSVVTIAASTSRRQQEVHKSIQYIARCLWPLYSRDVDTNMLGFDLQEYSDFFAEYSKRDRDNLKNKLIHEWKEGGYIVSHENN